LPAGGFAVLLGRDGPFKMVGPQRRCRTISHLREMNVPARKTGFGVVLSAAFLPCEGVGNLPKNENNANFVQLLWPNFVFGLWQEAPVVLF